MPASYQIGPFRLDSEAEVLFRADKPVAVGQRAFALLRALVERAGMPISKEMLIDAAWPGLAIEDGNLTVQISTLRRLFKSEPGGDRWIETLPRRGYRFIGPVSSADASGDPRATALSSNPYSIAVLPFVNMSDDPKSEYFADGITEEIITALSKWRWLTVIARNSTFTFKGHAVDANQVGKDLGVRYLLEGSVRKEGGRLRITAQLVDCATRQQLWAERFDGVVKDVFGFQDEITQRVANAVDPAIRQSELRRASRKAAEDLDAWDHFLRGSFHFFAYRKAEMSLARKHFLQAIEIEPHFAAAHARLAAAHGLEAILGWVESYPEALASARRSAETAIALDELDASGHAARARALLWQRQHGPAIDAARRATDLNSNYHEAFSLLGQCLTFSGRPRDADVYFITALRLSPRDPLAWATFGLQGLARYLAGQYELAIEASENALNSRQRYAVAHAVKAAAFSELGRRAEARQEIALVSQSTIGNIETQWPFLHDADLRRLLASLKAAASKPRSKT